MDLSWIVSDVQVFDCELDDSTRESSEAVGKEACCAGNLHLSQS